VPGDSLDVPPATDDPVTHADWLELRALTLADSSASHADIVAELRRTGSVEAVDAELDAHHPGGGGPDEDADAVDEGSETSQAIADAVFAELEDRVSSAVESYPFAVDTDTVSAREDAARSLYVFLLCLSWFGGEEAAGVKPRQLFEDISAAVAGAYFGPSTLTSVCQFGFPRRIEPEGFRDALNSLCARIGEGLRSREGIRITRDQKDATLDLIVWKGFPDGRPGSLMGFGQCATGANWREKTSEMNPDVFSAMWCEQPFVSKPTRLSRFPHISTLISRPIPQPR
jgi:hypothetical protein